MIIVTSVKLNPNLLAPIKKVNSNEVVSNIQLVVTYANAEEDGAIITTTSPEVVCSTFSIASATAAFSSSLIKAPKLRYFMFLKKFFTKHLDQKHITRNQTLLPR